MAKPPRGILLIVIIGAALVVTLANPQDQGDRERGRQSGWYSSRSRERPGPQPLSNPNEDEPNYGIRDAEYGGSRSNARTAVDDNDEPSYGNREDYGSKDPTYGRRTRPAGRTGGRSRPAGARRQPYSDHSPDIYSQPGAYNRNQPQRQPQPGRPEPQPDTPRQPEYGFVDPRQQPEYEPRPQPEYEPRPQPEYDPRPQPVYNPRPQPPLDTPRQPVFGGYGVRPQPGYDPRQQPGYDPRQQPGYDPRQQPVVRPQPEGPRQPVFGGYDPRPQPDYEPRPQPPPDTPRRPVFGGYDPKPPQYPTDNLGWQRPPAPEPELPDEDRLWSSNREWEENRRTGEANRRTGDMLSLIPGGRYQGPGNLGGSGPKDFVIGEEGVLCAPTCRGHCIIRDTECNCVQNVTCFNEYRHRLDIPVADNLIQPPDCRAMECKDPCGYKVQWPDGWCMCDIDPQCAARPASNAYTKREADLDLLISQRDAHMAELSRASRHSQKTKRDADFEP